MSPFRRALLALEDHPVRMPAAVAWVLLLFLASCQTTGTQGVGSNKSNVISNAFYTPLFDQNDHLKELVHTQKNYQDAATLYLEQKEFFAKPKKETEETLNALATGLNESKMANLEKSLKEIDAMNWPVALSEWEAVKLILSNTESTLDSYQTHPILEDPKFRSPKVEQIQNALNSLKERMKVTAKTLFENYDHFGQVSFFNKYPIDLGQAQFLDTHYHLIQKKILSASLTELQSFAKSYGKTTLGKQRWDELGNAYIDKILQKGANLEKNILATVLEAVSETKSVGFSPKDLSSLKIGFIEVTSKTLLKKGQIEFPAEIEIDLPIKVAKSDFDDALTNNVANSSDYLIVFDVVLAKAKRRVTGRKRIKSKVLVGYDKEHNPQYSIAQSNLNAAQANLASERIRQASSSTSHNYQSAGAAIFGGILKGMAEAMALAPAKQKVKEAIEALSSTSQFIEKPRYRKYEFSKAPVHASKLMTVHYYIIDKNKNLYFKSTFDINEKRSFNVSYGIHEDDPDRSTHAASGDTEEDVSEWEEASSKIKLTNLIDHYLQHKESAKTLPNLTQLRQEMMFDKNLALKKFEENNYSVRPLNDPRFDSVVVVYTAKGLGSGFFVTPDTILTNWHVVEDQKYIEMRMYDGQETFGKTLVSDVRLDLALIKVQQRGKPVKFYRNKILDLGATVEAIGHPKGLEFSITRGVISSIRKDSSFLSARSVGGDEVLFVQTDAPVNTGNSGGPLFLGDEVVGVNAQAYRKDKAEGLNFSIHYSEVLEFLRDNLPSFVITQS